MTMSNKIGFGSVEPKFQHGGKHPMLLKHSGILSRFTNPNVGPGSYEVSSNQNVKSWNKFSNQEWQRQFQLKRRSQIPYFTLKDKVEQRKLKEEMMGPGYYEIDRGLDYLTKSSSGSKSGILDSRSSRFGTQIVKNSYPGPGTYGIPEEKLEQAEKKRQDANVKPLLSRGGKSERNNNDPAFHIGPGLYEVKSCIDETVNKSTGKKGIYNCNSIDRSRPITIGHWAQQSDYNLGPGQYNIQAGEELFKERYFRLQGKFSRVSRDHRIRKDIHTELSSSNVFDLDNKNIGFFHRNIGAFGSTDKRMNKGALINFLGSDIANAGPGRYNCDISEIGTSGPTCSWTFKSAVSQISNKSLEHITKHRVKSINIPRHKRQIIDHTPKNDGKLRIHMENPVSLGSNLILT